MPASWKEGLSDDEQQQFLGLAAALGMTPQAVWEQAQAVGLATPKQAIRWANKELGGVAHTVGGALHEAGKLAGGLLGGAEAAVGDVLDLAPRFVAEIVKEAWEYAGDAEAIAEKYAAQWLGKVGPTSGPPINAFQLIEDVTRMLRELEHVIPSVEQFVWHFVQQLLRQGRVKEAAELFRRFVR